MLVASLNKARCWQRGRQITEGGGGTGLKTVFVSVCGNLQHL